MENIENTAMEGWKHGFTKWEITIGSDRTIIGGGGGKITGLTKKKVTKSM